MMPDDGVSLALEKPFWYDVECCPGQQNGKDGTAGNADENNWQNPTPPWHSSKSIYQVVGYLCKKGAYHSRDGPDVCFIFLGILKKKKRQFQAQTFCSGKE
jgi:hypothetical protein